MRESEIFAARAAECLADAEAAQLANVRERCERAGAAWSAMAERSRLTEKARAARDAAETARREAAVAAAGAEPPASVEVSPDIRPAMPLR